VEEARNYRVGPLLMVTHVTGEPAATRHFYRDMMAMADVSDRAMPAAGQAVQRELWGLDAGAGWTEQLYERPGLPQVPRVRVLAMDRPGPVIRPGLDVLLEGGLSVGFAVRNRAEMEQCVARGEALGIGTTAGITTIEFRRPDGSPYEALETHFRAPDDVYGLGVGRPEDLPPVGPIEPGHMIGGPAYSAQVVNHADDDVAFYRDVLGFEVRRDVDLTSSGPAGGLGLQAGTVMRFLQLYAAGSETGYLVMLDFRDAGKPQAGPIRPPGRGVAMWTFPTDDLDAVLLRCRAQGVRVQGGPATLDSPLLGAHRAATLLTPHGFLVELVQTGRD
jgi:catechol 2,3-dioxygenase-like lactoylglutathione lyase family enzyme